jgi:hypothetical protein
MLAVLSILVAIRSHTHEDIELNRIAFGSCNKQFEPQPVWAAVADFNPQLWLWTGDAVYASTSGWNVSALKDGYRAQTAQKGYQKLVQSGVVIDGVYDDHDYGLNDAGRELGIKKRSQQLFLDFIGVTSKERRERKGVYSSHVFGRAPRQVKIILLDTRFHRDQHFFPSLGSMVFGGIRIPFGALLAAMSRLAIVRTGFGRGYTGDVLGEEQWAWLEEQLLDSSAAVHIVVSSIQIFTSNPLVESWGHFPKAKRRLVDLMLRMKPSGLLFISGDVHFAELMTFKTAAPPNGGDEAARCNATMACETTPEASGETSLLEVTSSGLTHSCSGAWWGVACEGIVSSYRTHRARDGGSESTTPSGGGGGTGPITGPSYYTGKNFGTLEFQWADSLGDSSGGGTGTDSTSVVVSVRDTSGDVVLSATHGTDEAVRAMRGLGARVEGF